MEINPFEIKDICRHQLTRYLIQAISVLPCLNKPIIIDIGCGSGVPALRLSQHFDGIIYAVDTNETTLNYLKEKISSSNLTDKIFVFQQSVYEMDFPDKYFDIIIAEGLLNIIGFEDGLLLVDRFIKDGGYFIIHDEYKNHDIKLEIIKRLGYKLLNSIILDEHVWWNDYYRCLEKKLRSFNDNIISEKFNNEIKEIKLYKEQPMLFRSIYYILEKNASGRNST